MDEKEWNKLTLTQKRDILSEIVKPKPYTNDDRVDKIINIIEEEIIKSKKNSDHLKQFKHEAKIYCLNNNLQIGSRDRALIFGFAEWLKNKD